MNLMVTSMFVIIGHDTTYLMLTKGKALIIYELLPPVMEMEIITFFYYY